MYQVSVTIEWKDQTGFFMYEDRYKPTPKGLQKRYRFPLETKIEARNEANRFYFVVTIPDFCRPTICRNFSEGTECDVHSCGFLHTTFKRKSEVTEEATDETVHEEVGSKSEVMEDPICEEAASHSEAKSEVTVREGTVYEEVESSVHTWVHEVLAGCKFNEETTKQYCSILGKEELEEAKRYSSKQWQKKGISSISHCAM
jgi:hypothetical protein